MSKQLTLAGRDWSLLSYADTSLPEGVTVTLMYDPEQGRVAGRSGCNRYFGPATLREGTVEIGQLASTRRMCPPPVMEVEAAFLKLLQTASRYRIDDGQLFIDCTDGRQLVFVADGE